MRIVSKQTKLLIKRVVFEIQQEFPKVKQFYTLSPIPGFASWFLKQPEVKIKLKEQVFTQLIDSCKADLPKALVNVEINRMAQSTYANLKQRGADLKQFKLEPSMFEEQAKKTCKLRLILAEIVDKNNLRATPDQIKAMVNEFALNFDDTDEAVKWFYAEPSRLEEPTALATETNVVDWFMKQCKVQNKKTTFDELMTGSAKT